MQSPTNNFNQMDNEKRVLKRSTSEGDKELNEDSEKDNIPEIKDIYDYIYGNVKNKRVFYESKRMSIGEEPKKRTNSTCSTPSIDETKNLSQELDEFIKINSEKIENENLSPPANDLQLSSQGDSATVAPKIDESKLTSPSKKNFELHLEKKSIPQVNFIDERTEILNEINANLKMELDRVKQQLKSEILKTNNLNFEIANIESILETYYKEANQPKSTLSALYSAMKYYVTDERSDSQESYTFKRIKAISDYVEILKHKFEHQDRIIKNNFIENPYYSDIMIKQEATIKQLDLISLENEQLKETLKNKDSQDLETIKELNRQKFEIEKQYQEMEEFYKGKMEEKAIAIESIKEECNVKLKNMEYVLEQSKEEKKEIKKLYEAKLNNFQKELAIAYGKYSKLRTQCEQKIEPNIEL